MEKRKMDYSARADSGRSYDQSLGILNMDNMSTFGELTNNNSSTQLRVNERLQRARMMALETLQKVQKRDNDRKSFDQSNKENTSTNNETNAINNFVPFRQPNTIDISDLVLDESIHLESSGACARSASKELKISFEPAEMTGRSTLNRRDLNMQQPPRPSHKDPKTGARTSSMSSLMSVDEILASSFAPKARNLCETLRSGVGDVSTITDTTATAQEPTRGRDAANACSSLLSSYNESRSLPRTADMSVFTKASLSTLHSNVAGGGGTFSFRAGDHGDFDMDGANKSLGGFQASMLHLADGEEFAPGELMKSRLLMDEISWAQEYAAIPEAALSEDAKALAKAANDTTHHDNNPFETPSTTNSMIAGDPNFSVGNYFNMRSEDIWNIAKSHSPDKGRTPIALVDSEAEDNTVTTTTAVSPSCGSSLFVTPKVDNKTYKKPDGNTVTICNGKKSIASVVQRESKDSGLDTDNSYLLTMSAIDRALCHLDVETDCSSGDIIEEIKRHAKRAPKSPSRNCGVGPQHAPRTSANGARPARVSTEFLAELISENKENLDPRKSMTEESCGGDGPFSDTMSFTDSLLNSSEMKRLNASTSPPQARSPLSPIPLPAERNTNVANNRLLAIPQLKFNDTGNGHDPDVDEWPSSPVITPNRVRRTKSPNERNKQRTAPVDGTITPVSSAAGESSRHKHSHTQPRSLCSTRLESAKSSDVATDFVISPNMSKSSIHMRNATLTPTSANANGSRLSPCHSSLSSPRSYLSASGASSPHLDSTTNSERRQLATAAAGIDGAIRKAASSPSTSERGGGGGGDSTSRNGGAPSRSCSCNSMKSSTTTTSRSLSRCSNSSEFSHRDGKIIPLKVTTLELSWSSTKLRTDSRKSMQVKNIANKRLIVRVQVHGPGYQIISQQGGGNHAPSMLTLHSQECRTIVINFCPTVTGVAIGMLAFYSPNTGTSASGSITASSIGSNGHSNGTVPFLEIPLYGYGGHSTVIPRNILKGPVGDAFLPMGDLYELAGNPVLERNFEIFNKGPLTGFAVITVNSSGVNMPRLHDAFKVQPNSVLIPAGGVAVVRVSFHPKRDDMKKIMKKISHVLTLANMRVICGDEANRQRMRRLVERMSPSELAKITPANSLDKLWQKFPDEVALPDLEPLGREKTDVTFDLLTSMRVHEIAVTLNHDALDDTVVETSSLIFPDADETVLFRTVCASNESPAHNELDQHDQQHQQQQQQQQQRSLETVEEMFERTHLDEEANGVDARSVVSSSTHSAWSVSPKYLEFDFNSHRKRTESSSILIRNDNTTRQYFEVICNYKGVLRFMPDKGYIESNGGQCEVKVETVLERRLIKKPDEPIAVIVYLEHERITVPIRVPRLEQNS